MTDDELMAAFGEGAAPEDKQAEAPQNTADAQLAAQLGQAVELKDGDMETIDTFVNKSRVGCLKRMATMSLSKEDVKANIIKPDITQPKDLLKPGMISEAKPGDKDYSPNALAYCSSKDGKIVLQDYQGELRDDDLLGKEYQKGNTIAKLSVAYHELTHYKHFEYDNSDDFKHPVDIIKGSRLSEKVATAVQYNNAAQLYTILKDQNVTQISVNGETKPIESILEPFEGLKEYVTQNGYSPNNKKDVRAVTEIASNWWNEKREQGYTSQHLISSVTRNGAANIFDALKSDEKVYDATAKSMLKDVYIGNNTNIDLSHCRDLLDDMTNEQALELTGNQLTSYQSGVTFKNAEKISAYLETKGLKTDEEKLAYLQENFDKMVLRNGEYDKDLKELLLNLESPDKGTIVYADGLEEHRGADGSYSLKKIGAKQQQNAGDGTELGVNTTTNTGVSAAGPAEIPADDKAKIAALSGRSGRYQSPESLQAEALQAEQTIDAPTVAPASQEVTQQAQTAQPQQAQPAPQQAVAEAQPAGKKVKDMSPQEKHEFINENLRMGNNPNLSGESKKSRKKTKTKARTVDNTVAQAQTLQAGR